MALVDVIRADEIERLKVCAGDDCEDVLVDLWKNRSRKFCDGGCGNRANVAAYRARKASTTATPDPEAPRGVRTASGPRPRSLAESGARRPLRGGSRQVRAVCAHDCWRSAPGCALVQIQPGGA